VPTVTIPSKEQVKVVSYGIAEYLACQFKNMQPHHINAEVPGHPPRAWVNTMKDSPKPPLLLPVILLEQFFGMEGVVAYSLLGAGELGLIFTFGGRHGAISRFEESFQIGLP
jgi:hypothetical protein